jgi:Zn-finger nucleic acid-binding protein
LCDDADMNCPRCIRRTQTADLGAYRSAGPIESPVALVAEPHPAKVTIARCPSCTGAFASHEAMNAIDSYGRERGRGRTTGAEMARRAAAPGGRTITCPDCNSETTRREWSFSTLVFVDICIECRGVWMDGGELEALDGTPTP